jgi:predicted transcriptional regulator
MNFMNQQLVIETLKKMPQQFDVEELIERLIFIDKVEEGLEDSKNGKVVSFDEAKERLSKWLK